MLGQGIDRGGLRQHGMIQIGIGKRSTRCTRHGWRISPAKSTGSSLQVRQTCISLFYVAEPHSVQAGRQFTGRTSRRRSRPAARTAIGP